MGKRLKRPYSICRTRKWELEDELSDDDDDDEQCVYGAKLKDAKAHHGTLKQARGNPEQQQNIEWRTIFAKHINGWGDYSKAAAQPLRHSGLQETDGSIPFPIFGTCTYGSYDTLAAQQKQITPKVLMI